MTRNLLGDALDHHIWASLLLIDACLALTPEQLETSVPGTYGSILDTMRHLVGADSWYLFRLMGDRYQPIDEEHMDLPQLRSEMEAIGAGWAELMTVDQDPDEVISVVRDDGSETHAPRGMRLAQVLHHGTDHRSQVCTAITSLGIEPPNVDVWAWGEATGRNTEIPARS